MLGYIVGAVPTGKRNQVESKSHKVSSRRCWHRHRLCSVYCVSIVKILRNTGVRVPSLCQQFSGIHIMVIISDCLSEDGSSILPCRASLVCECGEMVYARDLKSLVERHAGSSPATRTNLPL